MNRVISTSDIRTMFLEYFARQGHNIIASSSLIPQNDKTLFFTNAGMVQFKDLFLGREQASYVRAATVQRCLRASGKHNDLTNVGYTNRHHTFFEMLGNFSFGDYFKAAAIHYAWSFLTEILAIEPKKLWITVHNNDKEAELLWHDEFKSSGKQPQGLSHCGDQDNFWAMGETGPCGYCSEIFYDHGAAIPGDPPGGKVEGERYVEIWNLVFMQFEKNNQGQLELLPKPSVDTGMGLERIAAVMQGVSDNYQIDIFNVLIDSFLIFLKDLLDERYDSLVPSDIKIASRVVADHIRSATFLIADGVVPSNEKAGYVLRSIIRRAVYYLYRLGVREPLFFKLAKPLVQLFNDIYPEMRLDELKNNIAALIKLEEIRFLETLDRGLKIFEVALTKLVDNVIPGSLAFNLHDTYGLPIILTEEIAEKRGLIVNKEEFAREMEKQRLISSHAVAKDNSVVNLQLDRCPQTDFVGYTDNLVETKIVALFDPVTGKELTTIDSGDRAIMVLEITPFYGESGGQVGDVGEIRSDIGIFKVQDTQKQGGIYLHHGELLDGSMAIHSKVIASINVARRQKIALNHTATHLLHRSLRMVIGENALQRGSFVDDRRLRLDFAYSATLAGDTLQEVERLVNRQIRDNVPVVTDITSREEAKRSGADALFDEKYGDNVRVVTIGSISKEFCGGTHASHSGALGLFKIVSESSIASGVRRIEAVTGENALDIVETMESQLRSVAHMLSSTPDKVSLKIKGLLEERDEQNRYLKKLRDILSIQKVKELVENAVIVDGVRIINVYLEDSDSKSLRELADRLKKERTLTVIVLSTLVQQYLSIVVGVTDDLTSRLEANILLQHLTGLLESGKGGGRKNLAQGGGIIAQGSPQQILEYVIPWVRNKFASSRV